MNLINALQMLNVQEDAHWTKEGLPVLSVLENLTEGKVSRTDIPKGFNKFTAASFDFGPLLAPEPQREPASAHALAPAPLPDMAAPAPQAELTREQRLQAVRDEIGSVREQIADLEQRVRELSAQESDIVGELDKANSQISLADLIRSMN